MRRSLGWCLAVYLFIWFGLVVPGHRRGVVSLSVTASCCDCFKTAASGGNLPARAKGCAICDFAAHLMMAPPVDFSLAPLAEAERVRPDAAVDLVARLVLNPFDGRGPPVL